MLYQIVSTTLIVISTIYVTGCTLLVTFGLLAECVNYVNKQDIYR